MLIMADAAKIWDPAHIPQQAHRGGITCAGKNLVLLGQRLERLEIVCLPRAHKGFVRRGRFKRLDQPVNCAELQRMVAPVQFRQRGKAVVHDGLRHLWLKRACIARGAEAAIFCAAAGAPCDLRQLIRRQGAHPAAIKFTEARERHMVHIKVQAHTNGVRGHKVVNLAGLIHRHLRITRARAERAHYHGRAALGAAQQLCNGIDILNREPNDGRTRAHSANLFLTRKGQLGHPVPRQILHMRHKR